MTAEDKAELLTKLQNHESQAQREGLIAKPWGFGVLVICLPEYGDAEQLLLKEPEQKAEPGK